MDAIDNIIFATLRSPLQNGTFILSDYIAQPFGPFVPGNTTPAGTFNQVFNFSLLNKMVYTSFPDSSTIEKAIERHWYDVDAAGQYFWTGIIPPVSNFTNAAPYHLMYAYLIENTRILQIFERVIDKYLHDEEFGITVNLPEFQWLLNSESLFFKSYAHARNNDRSLIRPSSDANRRNAYFRMFGMDLAFGDINSISGGTYPYLKAKSANLQFIALFERFLAEVWQGYINARNTSGPNTTDVNNITEIATQLQELLYARRGGQAGPGANIYGSRNLSREEFASGVLVSWFTYIISWDSPVVEFLNCQSSTIGERLLKIGAKVGIPAHSKSQALFEMAGAASNLLTTLEAGGTLDNPGWVTLMLSSLNPPFVPTLQSDYMNEFLTVINNWEKATGHRIKNPEASLNGTIRLEQKSIRPQVKLN